MSLEERIKYAEMKARHTKSLRPWYKKGWGISLIILGILILIPVSAGSVYFLQKLNQYRQELATGQTVNQEDYKALIDGQGNYWTGAANPKITIVEFTDFACPFCQQSAAVIRKLVDKHQEDVRLVVRDYPIHEGSIDMAVFARCAGEQGQYFKAYDYLFANQEELKASADLDGDLLSLAQYIGLDSEKFSTCYKDRSFLSAIKKDYYDGNSLEIAGTPTWFVNYYPITGSYSENKLEELIAGTLADISLQEQEKTQQ